MQGGYTKRTSSDPKTAEETRDVVIVNKDTLCDKDNEAAANDIETKEIKMDPAVAEPLVQDIIPDSSGDGRGKSASAFPRGTLYSILF